MAFWEAAVSDRRKCSEDHQERKLFKDPDTYAYTCVITWRAAYQEKQLELAHFIALFELRFLPIVDSPARLYVRMNCIRQKPTVELMSTYEDTGRFVTFIVITRADSHGLCITEGQHPSSMIERF